MTNNLHISYDLSKPGQNYEAIIKRIQELGIALNIHQSFWYVKSRYGAEAAVNHIKQSMDGNDSLYVVNTTNNTAAWENIPNATKIKEIWNKVFAD